MQNLLSIDLKLIGWILGIILIVLLLLAVAVRRLVRFIHQLLARRAHELDREQMRKRWERITAMLASPDGARLAVIEADNLLDFVLKAMHLPGETMAFRLKFAQNKFYELKRVRWAHSLRNNVVHEPDFRFKSSQAYAAIKEYERALKLLGAL